MTNKQLFVSDLFSGGIPAQIGELVPGLAMHAFGARTFELDLVNQGVGK
jgi:hypothetical protein